jgi:nucleoside-diphosphate-sugar epimerase
MSRLICVTGGAGYIGINLIEQLVARGERVRVIDRFFWGKLGLEDLPGIELISRDVRELQDGDLEGVDTVCHLAGLSNDPTADLDPNANWQMNMIATKELADAAIRMGVRRITFGSSGSIYDGAGSEEILDEDAAVAPLGPYSESKYAAERALLDVQDRVEVVLLRQGTVGGYSRRMRYDLVVNTFLKDALLKKHLFLHEGGFMFRPLVDVQDVAMAHVVCIDAAADKVAGKVLNVVQDNYQVKHLAEIIAEAVKPLVGDIQLSHAPATGRIRDYRASNDRMTAATGFTPLRTPVDSVASVLEHIGEVDPQELTHPRHYNLRWMQILTEVHELQRSYERVF